MIHVLAFKVVGKKVHEFSTRGTGVARCIRGKVITPVPGRRVCHGVAESGLTIRAAVGADPASTSVNVTVIVAVKLAIAR